MVNFIDLDELVRNYEYDISLEASYTRLDNLHKELSIELANVEKRSDNDSIIQESLSENIKTFANIVKMLFNKLISFLIRAFQALIRILKSFIKSLISKFKNIIFRNASNSDIKYVASFSNLDELNIKCIKKYDTIRDVFDDYKENTSMLINKIDIYSKQNVQFYKKLRDANINRVVNESYEEIQISLFEELIYYDFKPILITKTNNHKLNDNTLLGNNLIDEIIAENLQTLKVEDLEMLIKEQEYQETIYFTFRDLIIEKIINFFNTNKVYNQYDKYFENKGIVRNSALSYVKNILNISYTKYGDYRIFDKYLKANIMYYENTLNPYDNESLRDFINLAISTNKATIQALQNMVKIDYSMFYINYNFYYRNQVKNNILDSPFKGMNGETLAKRISHQQFEEFNRLFYRNFFEITLYNNELFDFSYLNLGKVIVSPDIIRDSSNPLLKYTSVDYSALLYRFITNFDITIMSHGGVKTMPLYKYYNSLNHHGDTFEQAIFKSLYYEEIVYLEKLAKKPISKITGNEMITIDPLMFNKDNFIIKGYQKTSRLTHRKYPLRNILVRRWVTSPVKTPLREGIFTDVECLLYKLLREQYKRINVVCCNPGHVDIQKYEFRRKGCLIAISKENVTM